MLNFRACSSRNLVLLCNANVLLKCFCEITCNTFTDCIHCVIKGFFFFNFELQKQQAFHNGWDAQDYQSHPRKCLAGARLRLHACDKLQDCSWAFLGFVLIYKGWQEFSSCFVVNLPEPVLGRILEKNETESVTAAIIYTQSNYSDVRKCNICAIPSPPPHNF